MTAKEGVPLDEESREALTDCADTLFRIGQGKQ